MNAVSDLRYQSFLAKTVTVIIDRPAGSCHPKHGFTYPINYGYVAETVAGDGEPVDVYIMGTTEPLGRVAAVVGIVWRNDDLENKLIATMDGTVPALHEVESTLNFQEQFFRTHYTLLDT